VAQAEPQEWHPAVEQYCETVYELAEDGVDVVQARIAERLGVTRPSVSSMIHRLAGDGYLRLDGNRIVLSAKGRRIAERVVRRHRLAERFLTDALGLPWAVAHREAGKWEHVISPEVEDALDRFLDHPTTCPHGNPIPGAGWTSPDVVPLAELEVGETFCVSRIPEELEFAEGTLEFLESSHLRPGAEGRVLTAGPDGTVTVEVEGTAIGLGPFLSERVQVLR
jgi:DtxR family Mn-dependent transcriptional regulator